MWVQSLSGDDPLEEEMATNSCILTCWDNPMDRGAWRTTVQGVQRVRQLSNRERMQLTY